MLVLICTEVYIHIYKPYHCCIGQEFHHVALQFILYGPTAYVTPIAVCSHYNWRNNLSYNFATGTKAQERLPMHDINMQQRQQCR